MSQHRYRQEEEYAQEEGERRVGEMEMDLEDATASVAGWGIRRGRGRGRGKKRATTSAGIPPDLQALIRLHLPISSCIKFASVSKEWYSTIASPAFTDQISHLKQGKSPFFFVLSVRSWCFHFDPVHGRWFHLERAVLPANTVTSLDAYKLTSSSKHGLMVLYSDFDKPLYYAMNPTCTKWHPIPSVFRSYPYPILYAFAYSPTFPDFTILVVGRSNVVSVYDSTTYQWKHVYPIHGFRAFGSSALHGNKIYFANKDCIEAFDVDSLEWTDRSRLELPGAVYYSTASSDMGVFAVAICPPCRGGRCVKLFKIDELSMVGEEVSVMPGELWCGFQDNLLEAHGTRLSCVGSGKLLYVYNGSFLRNIYACMCDLEDYTWRQLPNLPPSCVRHDSARVTCCSLQVSPLTYLRTTKETETVGIA